MKKNRACFKKSSKEYRRWCADVEKKTTTTTTKENREGVTWMIEVSECAINGGRKKTEFGFRNALILRWWLQEPAAPASVLTQAAIVCEVLSCWNRNTVGIPVNSQTSNHPCLDPEKPVGSWHFPGDWFWPQIGGWGGRRPNLSSQVKRKGFDATSRKQVAVFSLFYERESVWPPAAPPYNQQGKFEDESKAEDICTDWWRAQRLGGTEERFSIHTRTLT